MRIGAPRPLPRRWRWLPAAASEELWRRVVPASIAKRTNARAVSNSLSSSLSPSSSAPVMRPIASEMSPSVGTTRRRRKQGPDGLTGSYEARSKVLRDLRVDWFAGKHGAPAQNSVQDGGEFAVARGFEKSTGELELLELARWVCRHLRRHTQYEEAAFRALGLGIVGQEFYLSCQTLHQGGRPLHSNRGLQASCQIAGAEFRQELASRSEANFTSQASARIFRRNWIRLPMRSHAV